MLNSLILVLIILNIYFKNLSPMLVLFIIGLAMNIILNKELGIKLKKLKFLTLMYMFSFFVYILGRQEGEILFKVANIYITKEGVYSFLINYIRIVNLIILSFLIKGDGIISKRFERYNQIIEKVIDLVPQVFVVFRKKLKIKSFLKHILIKIDN